MPSPVLLPSAAECVRFQQESFGALHQLMAGLSEGERADTWAEVHEALTAYEGPAGSSGPARCWRARGRRPRRVRHLEPDRRREIPGGLAVPGRHRHRQGCAPEPGQQEPGEEGVAGAVGVHDGGDRRAGTCTSSSRGHRRARRGILGDDHQPVPAATCSRIQGSGSGIPSSLRKSTSAASTKSRVEAGSGRRSRAGRPRARRRPVRPPERAGLLREVDARAIAAPASAARSRAVLLRRRARLVQVQRQSAAVGRHQVEVPLGPRRPLDDQVHAALVDRSATRRRSCRPECGPEGDSRAQRGEIERLAGRGATDRLVVAQDLLRVGTRLR